MRDKLIEIINKWGHRPIKCSGEIAKMMEKERLLDMTRGAVEDGAKTQVKKLLKETK